MNRICSLKPRWHLMAIIAFILWAIVAASLKSWESASAAFYGAFMLSWVNYEQLVMVWRKVRAARRRKGLPS